MYFGDDKNTGAFAGNEFCLKTVVARDPMAEVNRPDYIIALDPGA